MKHYYKTLTRINQPVRLVGLSPYQFFGAIVLLGMSIAIGNGVGNFGLIGNLLLLVCEASPIVLYASKVSSEDKKGNPTFVSSYIRFQSTPRRIYDERGVMNIIVKR